MRYAKEWEVTVNRIGRWIDFENDYKTLNLSYVLTLRFRLVEATESISPASWRASGGSSSSSTRRASSTAASRSCRTPLAAPRPSPTLRSASTTSRCRTPQVRALASRIALIAHALRVHSHRLVPARRGPVCAAPRLDHHPLDPPLQPRPLRSPQPGLREGY